MEPQKEARTPRDPVARLPGASRSQKPDEEERREGCSAPAATAFDAEADGTSADGLWELPVEPAERRPECSRCSRPQKVCLCPFLPLHPLHISTHLYIIQHPAEENKVLRTVPLLAACLPQDKCKVKIGRRFSEERDPELSTVCRKSDTLILYPGAEAANLEEFILDSPIYPSTIIIIDGTWSQAKDIFYKNSLFRLPKQTLLRPLQALCSFQLQHGAQIRLSKEHLLKNGLYPKPMPKNKRKLRKMELLMNSIKI
ncbi:tRNA-uridine aminocarboxypropyltransferase 2 isoform X3 [Physeter macrocephalus]|uniref:tRNA-uridine aminocarboxypropyltransferase n=1 Tax=Physeter macrocephalus TaxID=9755 RepID=A0A2Y9T0Z9_PHYMC|nr:tRNA-uridine aminocarboxypropyltransferase 2 isoform X3 [Physeter catodon]|eukprot:XP_023983187.1 DTW domain-containing protein 2 isoform X3 [Physeter catodon]